MDICFVRLKISSVPEDINILDNKYLSELDDSCIVSIDGKNVDNCQDTTGAHKFFSDNFIVSHVYKACVLHSSYLNKSKESIYQSSSFVYKQYAGGQDKGTFAINLLDTSMVALGLCFYSNPIKCIIRNPLCTVY